MTVIGRSNHAFFFDGVSDSIIIPEGQFTALGHKTLDGASDVRNILDESPHGHRTLTPSSGKFSNYLVIEAWIMPDCGGTVIEKEGQFKLTVGNVDTPGPAVFEVFLKDGVSTQRFQLSTATKQSTRYEGTVYPSSSYGGIHDSYNRFTGLTYDDATDLNRNHRPLLHVVAAVKSTAIELYVNGSIVVSKDIKDTNFTLAKSNAHVYVGGKGGQFRGVIEAVHLNGGLKNTHITGNTPLPDGSTQLLYRFEEPISPIEGIYNITNIATNGTQVGGQSVTISQITLSDAEATALAKKLTGLSTVSGNYAFTSSPYSNGDYEITQSTSSGTTMRKIPHVPYNILVNPGSINPNTKIPNQTPPERLRLHNINVDTNTCLVSSIHLDFAATPTSGIRGMLHTSRSTDVDNHFVVIGADLLIDSGTGKPYQPPHFSSQIVDRTGQMVIDEGIFESHGFVYSSRMATTTSDPDNPYAVVWPTSLDAAFQIGHSGRHTLNHVDGHEFLRILPRANDEIIDQQIDGSADIIDIMYDDAQKGVDKQISVNSRVDVYREAGNFKINDVVNSSTVTAAFNSYHNTSSPPAGKKKLIAIGGPNFDFTPFMLKGPVPAWKGTFNDETRKFHLRPSKESRVALLHVPQLSSTNVKFAPYVEIHYNAVDLTGASMSGTTQPLLMVEKTVPASDVATGGGSYIYDAIINAIGSGKTLYSPGGYIDIAAIAELSLNSLAMPHSMIGDVSEGYSADDELDDSLTPYRFTDGVGAVNFTPRADADSIQNSPPKVIVESVSSTGTHESVFNRIALNKVEQKVNLTDKGLYSRVEPHTTADSPSAGEFDTATASSSTPIHEVFDIIDNIEIVDSPTSDTRIIIQPSDRRRTNQLTNVKSLVSTSDDANTASLMYLMSRARVRSIEETEGEGQNFTTIRCIGLSEAATSRSINEIGRGSPDSHIVKEIEPNSPVVTVTLGGPGQGAMDTKPTNQPSILAHEPYSSRRAFAAMAHKLVANFSNGADVLHVKAINNESADMQSWGTYGFPRYGRVYLADGSSGKYDSKNGTTFTFSLGALGSGDFVSSSGVEYTSMARLLNATGFLKGETSGTPTLEGIFTVYNEPDFGEQSRIENGSTVNDRMFQSMSDVSHDYQLGTQYASTRALAEIPFFSHQFFDSGVGPDNGFKIHIDATHTAHTWNPSPVGRRLKDVMPADREAQSAYSHALANREYINSTFITKWDASNKRLYVNDINVFPDATTSTGTYRGVTTAYRYRKVWLGNGEWAWYSGVNTGDKYLTIVDAEYGHTSNFLDGLDVGTPVFAGGIGFDDTLSPLASDEFTPSSDFEGRSEYYYDAASVKTQGGNVDYGLRQYASAVEFKAGPESNPHAAHMETKRATTTVLSATEYSLGTLLKAIVITVPDEDFSKFPSLGYDEMQNMPIGTGTLRYSVQYDDGTNVFDYQYHGHLKKLPLSPTVDIPENGLVLVYLQTTPLYPASLNGKKITLAKKCRDVISSNMTTALTTTSQMHPLWSELNDNLMIDTNIVITAQAANSSAPYTIEITNQTGKNVNDLHGLNVKKDDILYYKTTANVIHKIGTVTKVTEALANDKQTITLSAATPIIPANAKLAVRIGDYEDKDAILNAKWLNPYAPGGLRNGDTVWANMSYNNPHAVEGLFAKSRGVLNEAQVWKEFNGGKGDLDTTNPRDSIPLENFLIGNTCLETARNYVQHVNRTVEENYKALGLTAAQAPTVAYVDPYLAEDGHARVLLYDTAHDREFVAFQDIHMQVQSSAQAAEIGWPKEVVEDGGTSRSRLDKITATYNGSGPSPWTTQIDVANGFLSQNPYIRGTQQSKFIESAYAHDLANRHTLDLLESSTYRDSPIASGVLINKPLNPTYYSAGYTGAMVVDGVDATTVYSVGDTLFSSVGAIAGLITAISPTSITVGGGIAVQLANNQNLQSNVNLTLPDDGRKIAGARLYGKAHGHHVHTGYSFGGTVSGLSVDNSVTSRTNDSVALYKVADGYHSFTRIPVDSFDTFTNELVRLRNGTTNCSFRDPSTFFDTPDGTRVIPAFLCLKGIRSTTLDLSSHEESRLQHLPQWKDMDFVRRLTIDCGEVAQKDGVVNTEAAAQEIVRLINQHAALNARYTDGSAHDPAPFWHTDNNDRGTHMGYIRAHIGREVQDLNGDTGYTVVIHSTVPGATGRNFCTWLDNSTGQHPYQPQFLIGHGGRWRNFWALPEEGEGENMHPAPLPLNKHGRPFAPITTLQQYITAEESGEEVRSVAEFEEDSVLRAVSDTVSGKNHNTINNESFSLKGSSSTLVKGLRVGSRATSRINFGGLVASGVPGWAPDAGIWGFGKIGDTKFNKRYGSSSVTSYSSHVPTVDKLSDAIGSGQLYGFRLKDNVGSESGLRFVYRKMGDSFANENTTLPSTIEEEVCVFFDDRDVAQGGFTVGNHMHGTGDATGRMDFGVLSIESSLWKGARWRGVHAPSIAAYVGTAVSGTKMTITFPAPFDAAFSDDKLGYLGFPRENGLIQISDIDGDGDADVGLTLSYTRRDGNVFYGITGLPSWTDTNYLITPVLNWTTLVTDELMAAVTAAAINAGREVNTEDGHIFDCTEMYAADGRTFGEWGVSENAVRIRAYNTQKPVIPLNEAFSATLHRDFGIQAAHLEFGEVKKVTRPTGTADWDFDTGSNYATSRAVTDALIDDSRGIDCGYIPYTLLQIRSFARGPHANTATPNLVDSKNTPVNINEWRENLKGIRYTRSSGDHILPHIDTPHSVLNMGWTAIPTTPNLVTDYAAGYPIGWTDAIAIDTGNSANIAVGDIVATNNGKVVGEVTVVNGTASFTIGGGTQTSLPDGSIINKRLTGSAGGVGWLTSATLGAAMFHFMIPAGNDSGNIPSFGEKKKVWLNEKDSLFAESKRGATSSTVLSWDIENAEGNITRDAPYWNNLLSLSNNRDFDGLRSIGSVFSEPVVYFRGGKSSSDHSVPLYFGGGFSGVTLDVNDGTNNDYSTFYTHPYANGPTGVAGIQNANEISTSFAMMDCNAMFAFFPGAALCNQHRGSINPPAFNRDNILSPDLGRGGSLYASTGEIKAKPVPLVLRFTHPTARYEDHVDGVDIDNKTTYIIFGPGQAFPFTQEVADAASGHNTLEPFSGRIIYTGNSWASVPSLGGSNNKFPNSIVNDQGKYRPHSKSYYNATAGFHWKAMVNWETPAGYCWKNSANSGSAGLFQRPEHGRMYGQLLNDDSIHNAEDFEQVHPKMHVPLIGYGITMGADTVFHMDGGFHAGGSWLDNQFTFNPVHPKKNTRITGGNSSSTWTRDNQIHPTAFRVAGPLMATIQDYIGSSTDFSIGNTKNEYILIDGTRCQNGEELATVVGAAINAFPGAGALKSMGGTHMPSMGNAMRQDRYGWVDLGTVGSYNHSTYPQYVESAVNASQTLLEQIPASGWLRVNTDDDSEGDSVDPGWAVYHSRDVIASGGDWKVRFHLAPNAIRGQTVFEYDTTWANHKASNANSNPTTLSGNLYVWSKAGIMQFNNEDVSARDHMTQVHFSGIVDAIDRTRPVGVAGWHGERYSYLNSLKISTSVTKNDSTTTATGYAAGLGAYHSMLGFSPYGSAGSVMSTYGTVPVVAPMRHSPESTPTINGAGDNLDTYITKASLYTNYTLDANGRTPANGQGYFKDTDTTDNSNQWAKPTNYEISTTLPKELSLPQGLYSNAFLVVSYNSESSLIAKFDRDAITATGDWLHVKGEGTDPIHYAGTTLWDERFHGQDRFIAPANAGPNVEALIVDNTTVPTIANALADNSSDAPFNGDVGTYFHGAVSDDLNLKNATPGRAKTGDLLFDLDYSVGSVLLESEDAERNVSDNHQDMDGTGYSYTASGNYPNEYWMGDVNAFDMYKNSAAKNFSVEHIVWKRMDGGNLSLPTINARGLGAVPWMTRVKNNTAYTTGEKLYGNVRFTFETTNSAMLPVLQAQELAHPELMRKHPYKMGNVLTIPNEEIQFQSITVTDDAGQTHKIEGGSPLGTIIRGFRTPENRGVEGNGPALANSGKTPNLKVQLPNPDSIPGNIVVRSGFDPLQAYQNETMGTGGMIHPDLGADTIGHLFDNSVVGPRKGPTYEDHNWERIDPITFDSEVGAWVNNEPLHTSYELHDRTLFFHVCKMGHSHTHRYPTIYSHTNGVVNDSVSVTQTLGANNWNAETGVLTIDGALNTEVFNAGFGTKEAKDGRKFLRVYNPITDEGVVCSYLAENDTTMEIVGDVDFTAFMAENTTTALKVVPSYYIPGGSTRFFASRRLRDHAEVSGNSPDMAHTRYFASDTIAYNAYSKPKMTPMPYPRMGHHFITPTMPMLPGHWAHPAYQSLYNRHLADYNMSVGFTDSARFDEHTTAINKKSGINNSMVTQYGGTESTSLQDNTHPMDAEINFSGINAAPSGPSDIHGGAFTLMFETGLKYDGYGVLASAGSLAGAVNKAGGHSIVLEAAANYTLAKHFPDPAEVGAYQIIIQPNLFNNQLVGFHNNITTELTSQQVNTVIGINESTAKGGLTLVLAKATQADVRGCEVFINEAMLDVNPDFGSQFTNTPPLMLHNAHGIQMTESPAFTRRGFPYSTMFSDSSPGHTLHIPWWSILHKNGVPASNFRKLSQYAPDDYFMYSRNGFGSIGNQQTINGYTSTYLDIYSKLQQIVSLNPKCIVESFNTGGTITVDNANLFPLTSHYAQEIEYTAKNGDIYSKPYTKRSGNDAANVNVPNTIYLAAKSGADNFWDNIYDGAELRLSHSYNTLSASKLLTDRKKSVFANILPDIVNGNRDTYSSHIPDAFLCMWHPNLGRPNTYFSDSRTTWGSVAVDKASYNSMPEHFETIHYHDFTHAMSAGPFDFLIMTPNISKTGETVAATTGTDHQAGGTDVMLSGFWPCGSRGGPHVSKLDLFSYASASWNVHNHSDGNPNFTSSDLREWVDSDDDGSYSVSSGITTAAMGSSRRKPYGYRNAIRQACNRPTYGLSPTRAVYEASPTGSGIKTLDYDAGPLVQTETATWTYAGGSGLSNATHPTTYVGIMERQTNFTGMLAQDQADWQVRYSDGRRMTRPFGTPVRTLTNNAGTQRDWWGDEVAMDKTSLSEASQYYLVDWWGNERGEDVRRAPVRGFGIRPAWDCGDAYENDRRNSRSPYRRIWNNAKPIFNMKGVADLSNGNVSVTTTIPRFGGTNNDVNLHATNTGHDLVDVFAPTHSMRVGDMGNGRGVRYPTRFNEDVLTELSAPIHKTGVVLSHNTAEPLFGDGLLRPRNAILQADEVKRGISAKLAIDSNGLLKPEAVASDRIEEFVGVSPHKDAISRTSPRIGIDAEVTEGIEQNHIAINTEAHSLHTDRNVGQRVILHGGFQVGTNTIADVDYTGGAFGRQNNGSPVSAVHRYSHTNAFRPYGGSYVLDASNYAGLFDDTNWGVASLTGSNDTSNPYQDADDYTSKSVRNNEKDKNVKFLLRPIRTLDSKHTEVYRIHNSIVTGTPQYDQNYLFASSGGKYGLFTYEVSNGRAATGNLASGRSLPDGNGPYLPVFVFDPTGAFTTPTSFGPKLPGTEVSGFDKESLNSTVSRLVISDNTLQHHRSDAPRRRQEEDTDDEMKRMDFSVKPRFSQALHSKGHKGDISFSITDHSGDGA